MTVDLTEQRRELAALESLVGTPGWARVVEHMAWNVGNLRAITENPKATADEWRVAASAIQVANHAVRWPAERIEELRDEINEHGGVE